MLKEGSNSFSTLIRHFKRCGPSVQHNQQTTGPPVTNRVSIAAYNSAQPGPAKSGKLEFSQTM